MVDIRKIERNIVVVEEGVEMTEEIEGAKVVTADQIRDYVRENCERILIVVTQNRKVYDFTRNGGVELPLTGGNWAEAPTDVVDTRRIGVSMQRNVTPDKIARVVASKAKSLVVGNISAYELLTREFFEKGGDAVEKMSRTMAGFLEINSESMGGEDCIYEEIRQAFKKFAAAFNYLKNLKFVLSDQIAHYLKSPLSAMKSNLSLAKEMSIIGAEWPLAACETVNTLIDEMLQRCCHEEGPALR